MRADRLLYATMTGTDIALYRLDPDLRRDQARHRPQAADHLRQPPGRRPRGVHPVRVHQDRLLLPDQRFRRHGERGHLTWQDSIRYDPTANCRLVGGTSGSPIVDNKSGKIVGINNTANVDGESCSLNNPCEVDRNGSTKVYQGEGYGQETYWITTCLTHNTLDLTKAGCLLPKPLPVTP